MTSANHSMAFADHGACRGEDPQLFYPPVAPHKISAAHVDRVRPICRTCPVFNGCHAWAVANELDGIWAATSPTNRERLRRAMGIAAPSVVVDLAIPAELEPTVESLTADGRSVAEIASILGIHQRTVVRHRTARRKIA